jgi:ABC-type branched-subunit amino acid transport system substrate-binding protein
MRAAAALPLTGRYRPMALDAAHGLRAWAGSAGWALTIEDCGEAPQDAAALAVDLAGRADVLFGPYGSGAMRAVADAFAGRPWIVWNHGGAAVAHRDARIIDVLGPAEAYWAGLADVLGDAGVPLDRVAVLHADSGFGRAVASGAVRSLTRGSAAPLMVAGFDETRAADAAAAALAAGARAVIGCGRFEDDIALGRALGGADVAVGLVACGVRAAAEVLGEAVVGWFGPCQWLPGQTPPPAALDPGADYPAAQALAAGLVAAEAVARARGTDPDAVWSAARALTTVTFLGPFAVDDAGRQLAHRPMIVRWAAGPEGPGRVVAWRPEVPWTR